MSLTGWKRSCFRTALSSFEAKSSGRQRLMTQRHGYAGSVTRVVNEIKVLPVSSRNNELRIALYRAIYNWDSPLFRYATRAMPPIHILVENGRATLRGAVASQFESQIAYTAARQVPGIFEVRNELKIDN